MLSARSDRVLLRSSKHCNLQLDEAEDTYRRVLVINEAALGPDHLSTGMVLNNLPGVLKAKGQLDEAEGMFRHVLVIYEAAHGHHPTTGTSSSTNCVAVSASHTRMPRRPVPGESSLWWGEPYPWRRPVGFDGLCRNCRQHGLKKKDCRAPKGPSTGVELSRLPRPA